MDISEATTSQESPIISPDFDGNLLSESCGDTNHVADDLTKGVIPKATDKSKGTTITEATSETMKTSTVSTDANSLTALLKDNSDLDNRNCADNLENRNESNFALRGGLTLTSSHPLMSPSFSDPSDLDQIQYNYQDNVPANQPLRLAPPRQQPALLIGESEGSDGGMDEFFDPLPTNSNNEIHHHELMSNGSHQGISSGSEVGSAADLSQYQASVEPSFQSVTLVNNSPFQVTNTSFNHSNTRKLIPVDSELLNPCPGFDDVSSLETASNQSMDDDRQYDDFDQYFGDPQTDNHLISASVSSSLIDEADPSGAAIAGVTASMSKASLGPVATADSVVQPYSATEETKDTRGYQKITLPDGKTREIDMKVIEPYKRVLSHGGYLKAGGHNAIIVFSACYLPDRSRKDYNYVMDNLFLYVVKTLEQLVTEDYVLIYLHGGSTRSNVPPFPWLKKCYQLLDRKLRKRLKNLFMVHPTFWLKSIVWMARPFIRYVL